MTNFPNEMSKILAALRDDAAALSHWAYLAADTEAENAAVERIVTRMRRLMDALEAAASVQGVE